MDISGAHLKSQLVRITDGGTEGRRGPQPAAAAEETSEAGLMAAFCSACLSWGVERHSGLPKPSTGCLKAATEDT